MFFRKPSDHSLVRLDRVMRLRGAFLPDPLPPTAARHAEDARQRCLACRLKKLCDETLAAGKPEPFSLFCPNTHYIEHVRNRILRF